MYDSKAKAVGRRLRSGIADKGVTSDELANLIGVSRQSVSDWMNGKKVMSFENAIAICNVFDWPLDRLGVRGEFDDQAMADAPDGEAA